METRPWGTTGWPLEIFTEARTQRRKVLHCGRKECRRVLRDPWQLECGHRYCRACLDLISELPPDDRVCYLCIQDLVYDDAEVQNAYTMDFDTDVDVELRRIAKMDISKAYEDKPALREINRLNVKCPWDFEKDDVHLKPMKVKEIEAHIKSCKYREVKCELCSQCVQFRYYDNHCDSECPHREVLCPHNCGAIGIMAKDLNEHKASCTRRPEVCRICHKAMTTTIHQHMLEECEAACPLDCGESIDRKKIVEHLETPRLLGVHIVLLIAMLQELKEVIDNGMDVGEDTTAEKRSKFDEMHSLLSRMLQLEAKTESVERSMEFQTAALNSLSNDERRRRLLEMQRSTEKSAVHKSELESLDDQLTAHDKEVHLLSTYSASFHSIARKVDREEQVTSKTIKKLEGSARLRDASIAQHKLKLDELQKTSFDGHLVWKVSGVSDIRSKAQKGDRFSIYSPPFYTDVYGYKLCMRLYLNGDGNGKNTHISLFFVVMKGEYDALLAWPFEHKVNMLLRNQTGARPDFVERFRPEPASSSFERPKNDKNVASGCPQFATQADVYNEKYGYLVNDTLFFEVKVDKGIEPLKTYGRSTNHSANPGRDFL